MKTEEQVDILLISEQLSKAFRDDALNSFMKVTNGQFKKFKKPRDFEFHVIRPLDIYVDGYLLSLHGDNEKLNFLFKNYDFVEHHISFIFRHFEGSNCCVDKAKTIISELINYYKNNKTILFDYKQEFTYHLPEKVLKEHEQIIEFYNTIINLFYGRPISYLKFLNQLALEEGNKYEQ